MSSWKLEGGGEGGTLTLPFSLLFYTTEGLSVQHNKSTYNVHGSNILLRPIEESLRGDSFISSKVAYNFTTQSIFSTIMDDPEFTFVIAHESNTVNYVANFVRISKIIFQMFREKCHEVMNSRNMAVKNLYLKLLVYETLYEDRGTQSKIEFEK